MCKELESRIADLEKEIQKNSIPVDETLEKDMLSILADSGENEVTPQMRIFWEQQRKLLATPKLGRRYHPHVIRFCLSIHAKSPAAYRELRNSGILVSWSWCVTSVFVLLYVMELHLIASSSNFMLI